ncbi:MAG: hypothetical protein GC153_03655 [Alphaproteobacteria bacterium]|nr:hypothetical protein [Alphaproteobacteria bacterium]
MTDIRKEQLVLLRFEKQLAALAAVLATGASAAQAADGKLAAPEASSALAGLRDALMHLAEVTGAAHASLNASAIEAGARMLHASGGIPKSDPPQVVASLLGIG